MRAAEQHLVTDPLGEPTGDQNTNWQPGHQLAAKLSDHRTVFSGKPTPSLPLIIYDASIYK